MAFNIVEIDTVGQDQQQPMNGGGGPGGVVTLRDVVGPVQVGSNLYVAMSPAVFNGVIQVWKSTDGGATWTAAGASQACRNANGHFSSSTGLFTFAFLDNSNAGSNNPVRLVQFDTSTDTMGVPFGGVASQPSESAVHSVRVRSTGDIVVVATDSSGANTSYNFSVFSGGAWAVSHQGFDITGNGNSKTVSTAIDNANRIHIIVSVSAGAAYNVDYWSLDSTNVITGPIVFGWVTASGMDQSSVPTIAVSDAADTLYIANSRNGTEVRIFYGTPRSAPVWNGTFQGTLIGTIQAGDVMSSNGANITLGADGNLYIAVLHGPGGAGEFVDEYKTPASSAPTVWTVTQNIIDEASTNPPSISFFSQARIHNNPIATQLYFNGAIAGSGITRFLLGLSSALAVQCNNPPAGAAGAPYLSTFTGSGGTPPYTFAISAGSLPPGLVLNPATGAVTGTPTFGGTYNFTVQITDSAAATATVNCSIAIAFVPTVPIGGGNQIVHGGCKPLNEFDYCLLREVAKWKRMRPLPVCSVPEDLWTVMPWEPDWGSLPALAVPFRHIQSIVTPATAAGDQIVSQLIVPQGYDGILAGVFWKYNGVNFIEGSGDIFWRIQVNMRFVKDLSNVGFTLGSSVTPMPMTEGQQLQSRQRISVVVNVPNLSGTIQVGTSTITGGLFGFFWPKGVPGWTSR